MALGMKMEFVFKERLSDAPYVHQIWRTESSSDNHDTFISVAQCHWEMVVTKSNEGIVFTMKGPETAARDMPFPVDAEFIGIQFKLGTFMPHLLPSAILNDGMSVGDGKQDTFILDGSRWEFPDYDNADVFVKRLFRDRILDYDPIVEQALNSTAVDVSTRSVQRRTLKATGLTQKTIQQIQRAKDATHLLENGHSILDTVFTLGYADQAHMGRSLKRFMGRTASEITDVS